MLIIDPAPELIHSNK